MSFSSLRAIMQVPFLRSFAEENKYGMAPHYFTANAGPWFLYELLSKRGMTVDDPNDADIIYVHGAACTYLFLMNSKNEMYALSISMTSFQSHEPEHPQPGEESLLNQIRVLAHNPQVFFFMVKHFCQGV